jgi:hypothetical protein
MIQLPSDLRDLELEIEQEFKALNSDELPFNFQVKCINFIIQVLEFLLEKFDRLNLEDYLDFVGNYYLGFLHNNKGEEIAGLTLVHDMDPITDIFIEIRNLEKPYKKSEIQKIITWLNKFIEKTDF